MNPQPNTRPHHEGKAAPPMTTPEYRMLEEGETIRSGDEFLSYFYDQNKQRTWIPAHTNLIGKKYNPREHCQFRRTVLRLVRKEKE